MTIQITRWTLDTCGCSVEYQWDDAVTQDLRVHTLANVVSKCARHTLLGEAGAAHWNRISEENPRKNRLLGRLVAQFPALTRTDADGNVVLKDGAVSAVYDANHVLVVTIPVLTVPQRTAAQTWADANLGIGKVIVG